MPRIKYGNCVSCDFPILVKNRNPISCPACTTINQPVGADATPYLSYGVAFAVLGIVLITLIKSQK